MYTECPDCESACRVTAHVLQQGAGRVLCGRCGSEFNALERLTEDPPEGTEPVAEAKAPLETLDELTGPHEIRIEDTGIEWRVIVEDEDDGDGEEQVPEPTGPEIVAEEESLRPAAQDHLQDSLELSGGSEVQRYDDNTPLSDEFLDEPEPEIPQRRAEDHIVPRSPEADEAQVDLALGEPDDWVELLDEVAVPRNVQAAPAAEAAGAPIDDEAEPAAAGGSEEDDELADTDVRPLDEDDDVLLDPDYPSDIDTQFDLQAIEMGIDLTGSREELKLEDYPELEVAGPREDEDSGPEEHSTAAAPEPPPESSEAALATDAAPEQEAASAAASADGTGLAGADATAVPEEQEEAAPDEGAGTSIAAHADQEERLRETAFEEELEAAYSGTPDEAGPAKDERPQPDHVVPPQTAEEMTINMLIDQDLLRLAEQQQVFSSEKGRMRLEAPQVETIIMEGESVRTALEQEALAGHEVRTDGERPEPHASGGAHVSPAAADSLGDDLDGYVEGQALSGGRRTGPPGYAVIGGVAALALLLSVQVVHAWRESLATYPAFERSVGAVYRLFGEPLTPDWDVKAWQFESTSGSADDLNEVLTISSQLTNSSGKQMPYPLLHVSLTDRWEEIIGSKVLEPAEYLASGADPATRVPAGGAFTALVTVQSPSPEATGFKLNVCYRETGDRVRCATQDFKN